MNYGIKFLHFAEVSLPFVQMASALSRDQRMTIAETAEIFSLQEGHLLVYALYSTTTNKILILLKFFFIFPGVL